MKGFAENLSDQDIEDLSVYFLAKGLTIPPLNNHLDSINLYKAGIRYQVS